MTAAATLDLQLTADDDRSLAARLFEAAAPRAAVVICGGVGIAKEYYASFARFLAEAGLSALCLDYRGIGGSVQGSVRADPARLREWGMLDLPAAIRYLRLRYPELPLLAVGHSAGVQMVGLAHNNYELDACFGVAGQHGYWRWWTGLPRLQAWFLFHCMIPVGVRLFGSFPGRRIGIADLPRGIALEWADWCRRKGFVVAAMMEDGVPEFFSQFHGKMLSLSLYDDNLYAPKRAVDELTGLFSKAAAERQHVTATDVGGRAIGHFGFFRPLHRRSMWTRCLGWFEQIISEKGAAAGAPGRVRAV